MFINYVGGCATLDPEFIACFHSHPVSALVRGGSLQEVNIPFPFYPGFYWGLVATRLEDGESAFSLFESFEEALHKLQEQGVTLKGDPNYACWRSKNYAVSVKRTWVGDAHEEEVWIRAARLEPEALEVAQQLLRLRGEGNHNPALMEGLKNPPIKVDGGYLGRDGKVYSCFWSSLA